uniref:Ubiquitin-like domain-containing protein n=1 Tax=Chromera velia CCMP2878 TaxID=1169474 RepID=A0A0G4GKS9_9ALVE|eukprot:Cvel_4840.t1-p1 / transcript=Cvel_4840.t1 / gene=Cvel_4840 / organism=Chromera_velia_CCMP2878 / gene_product=hypothetical protein / transcript_product=hypothetical protein / location=Cvel_scaffold218:42654-46133(+) / protein_length=883 / sequence_SO=supercontig / SO=protein_coding / is_pseudo=false
MEPPSLFEVTAKCSNLKETANVFSVPVSPETSVAQLQEALQKKLGRTVRFIIFAGKAISGNPTASLAQLGIQKGSPALVLVAGDPLLPSPSEATPPQPNPPPAQEKISTQVLVRKFTSNGIEDAEESCEYLPGDHLSKVLLSGGVNGRFGLCFLMCTSCPSSSSPAGKGNQWAEEWIVPVCGQSRMPSSPVRCIVAVSVEGAGTEGGPSAQDSVLHAHRLNMQRGGRPPSLARVAWKVSSLSPPDGVSLRRPETLHLPPGDSESYLVLQFSNGDAFCLCLLHSGGVFCCFRVSTRSARNRHEEKSPFFGVPHPKEKFNDQRGDVHRDGIAGDKITLAEVEKTVQEEIVRLQKHLQQQQQQQSNVSASVSNAPPSFSSSPTKLQADPLSQCLHEWIEDQKALAAGPLQSALGEREGAEEEFGTVAGEQKDREGDDKEDEKKVTESESAVESNGGAGEERNGESMPPHREHQSQRGQPEPLLVSRADYVNGVCRVKERAPVVSSTRIERGCAGSWRQIAARFKEAISPSSAEGLTEESYQQSGEGAGREREELSESDQIAFRVWKRCVAEAGTYREPIDESDTAAPTADGGPSTNSNAPGSPTQTGAASGTGPLGLPVPSSLSVGVPLGMGLLSAWVMGLDAEGVGNLESRTESEAGGGVLWASVALSAAALDNAGGRERGNTGGVSQEGWVSVGPCETGMCRGVIEALFLECVVCMGSMMGRYLGSDGLDFRRDVQVAFAGAEASFLAGLRRKLVMRERGVEAALRRLSLADASSSALPLATVLDVALQVSRCSFPLVPAGPRALKGKRGHWKGKAGNQHQKEESQAQTRGTTAPAHGSIDGSTGNGIRWRDAISGRELPEALAERIAALFCADRLINFRAYPK